MSENVGNNKKVLLGMSGGVDSSVSAVLLKNQGYDVIGVNLTLWGEDKENNKNACEDAKLICDQIGIPFYSYEYKEEFKNKVINDFISCYSSCKTPNPCIECNKYLKFGAMFDLAEKHGAKYLATGHYAKTEYSEEYKRWVLKKSNAGRKDQSYVLWSIPKEKLEYIIFPLEGFKEKDEIRKIASDNNLNVANKPDSEDICFIPDGDYKRFLEENSNIRPKKGKIVHVSGKVLGMHTGLYNYTIGQRKGLGISFSEPLFVVGFNSDKNEVIVGEHKYLFKKEILVTDINLLLIDDLDREMRVSVKTRYSAKEAMATIKKESKDIIKVIFDEEQRAVTPGQSAVFYIGDIVLGGGKIIN